MFALHAWHKPMVYDNNALKGALETESTLRNFFRTTNALLRPRKLDGVASIARWQVDPAPKQVAEWSLLLSSCLTVLGLQL